MISKDIKNLTFAGRSISFTHAALSSSRVMDICAIWRQALATSVAQSVNENVDIRGIDIDKLPETLIKKYSIEGEDTEDNTFCFDVDNSHQRFVKHSINKSLRCISFLP